MTCYCACGGLDGHNPETCCHGGPIAAECEEFGACGLGECRYLCTPQAAEPKRLSEPNPPSAPAEPR